MASDTPQGARAAAAAAETPFPHSPGVLRKSAHGDLPADGATSRAGLTTRPRAGAGRGGLGWARSRTRFVCCLGRDCGQRCGCWLRSCASRPSWVSCERVVGTLPEPFAFLPLSHPSSFRHSVPPAAAGWRERNTLGRRSPGIRTGVLGPGERRGRARQGFGSGGGFRGARGAAPAAATAHGRCCDSGSLSGASLAAGSLPPRGVAGTTGRCLPPAPKTGVTYRPSARSGNSPPRSRHVPVPRLFQICVGGELGVGMSVIFMVPVQEDLIPAR